MIMAQITIEVFGFMYFCKTQIGISKIRETTFQTAKNNPTRNIESKINQKKNTTVKWKIIVTNPVKAQTISKFLSFISFAFGCIQTKLTIFITLK